jgi:hypothetical protein
VDATGALKSIVELLPNLPDESVEGLLVTFDALVGVSDEVLRPSAAQLLRDAAETSRDPTRRDRLLSAASAVAAGQPCALTADGLTAKQAAAAQTVTKEEWEDRVARTPLPPLPGDIKEREEEEEEETSEDSPYMEEPPPKLPHLRVRQFFPGMVVRVGRDFADAYGRAVCSGDLLKVLVCERTNDGYAVMCLERNIRLSDSAAGHDAIIENADNFWFQPVPTTGCLEDLLEAIDLRMSEAEEDEDNDDSEIELIEALREDIAECENWLSRSGERGPAPRCHSGSLAARVFGRDHELTAWIQLLFAAIAVCISDL